MQHSLQFASIKIHESRSTKGVDQETISGSSIIEMEAVWKARHFNQVESAEVAEKSLLWIPLSWEKR